MPYIFVCLFVVSAVSIICTRSNYCILLDWDMRMDSAGRHVYVNHSNRSVTVEHPSLSECAV